LRRATFSRTVGAVTGAPCDPLRVELRAWLAEHPPPAVAVATGAEEAECLRAWQRELHEGGWVGIHWPVEHGGRGASPADVAAYHEELACVGAPPLLGRAGVTLVGPTLVAHGTEDQRTRWMARILAGDDVWCQLFSEPDAGSDLAAVATRAERHGDVYRVTGQKVWSSYARFATMGICLVRTDPNARPSRGISMLAVPMDAPGVDVRPLRQITGDREFNEVFLDGVEVPASNLIGEEHGCWQVASTTLANERGASFIWREEVLQRAAVCRLVTAAAERGVGADAVVRQRLAGAWIDAELFRLHNARTLDRFARGVEIGSESSLVKLFWATASQRLAETAIAVLGPRTLADDPEGGEGWAQALLATRANSIMGGTSEIQRTIVGERLLGLPREPRAGAGAAA
jgi:alkylation response protein AidB-like acyl-CoA dehydrogenase